MRWLTLCAAALAAATASYAVDCLYDFEQEDQATQWRVRSQETDSIYRTRDFATNGEWALAFEAPAWEEGREQWPGLECSPRIGDWRKYDRLVVDITNKALDSPALSLVISDRDTRLRQAFLYEFDLPPLSAKRFVIPLSWPSTIDRSAISVMSLFGQRPSAALNLRLDSITLLEPRQEVPPPLARLQSEVAGLTSSAGGDLQRDLQSRRTRLLARCQSQQQQASFAELIRQQQVVLNRRVEEFDAAPTAEKLRELARTVSHVERKLDYLDDLVAFSEETATEDSASNMMVGFATGMQKVLPRDVPFKLTRGKALIVRAARGERESAQVVVTPREGNLENVRLSVGHLRSASGDLLRAGNIDCDVVGYVQTRNQPPYWVPYIGWWPEPILDFLGPVNIQFGDLQSFWIRVRIPANQPRGIYNGNLVIRADGTTPLVCKLRVQVYGFKVPPHSPLPTATAIWERQPAMGGWERWPELKFKWADFLADYYINYDNMYRTAPPDFEIIKYLHRRARLVSYNLGNVYNQGITVSGQDETLAEATSRLRTAYRLASDTDTVDHAYIYGFDERGGDQIQHLEETAQALKDSFPEVMFLTTSQEPSYGQDAASTVNAWCPLTPLYDLQKATTAREYGKKVWWYVCSGPNQPYSNWFIEHSGISGRLLMGAMTALYKPDGYLYWSLNQWNQNAPIADGPFTPWDPGGHTNSYGTYHGDGFMFEYGADGKPIPSIRLENYRDGLEDYAYACILEEIIRRYKGNAVLSDEQRGWLEQAEAALPVPETLVTSMTVYSTKPADLYDWRHRIATLIEESDMPTANPWQGGMGVRGVDRDS